MKKIIKTIIKAIVKSNSWYDNLPELKRDLFFLVVIFGSLIVAQLLGHIYKMGIPWPFIIWASVVAAWRCTSVFYHWRKDYLKRKNND